MTEYDLAKKQLLTTLAVALDAAHRDHWATVQHYCDDTKVLAQHLLLLQSREAPHGT
jgi:hypothetical protein